MRLCIFGAGGFAKEVFWLAKRCGYETEAFIDLQDGALCDTKVCREDYFDPTKHQAIVTVGNPKLRRKIVNRLCIEYGEEVFATLVSPYANLMSNSIQVGLGSVICAGCILTCDIELGKWSQLNLATTIGHDVKVGEFFTTAPGTHINGNVSVGNRVYFGSNACTVEGISICDDVLIGASACASRSIIESGTYVGIPARKIEKHK